MAKTKLFLAMTAAAIGAAPSPATTTCPAPLPNWQTAAAVPSNVPRPRNVIRLDPERLLWNGREISESQARMFLDLTTQMRPQPLMVLSYSARTPCERIRRARALIQNELRCESGQCLEVTRSSS